MGMKLISLRLPRWLIDVMDLALNVLRKREDIAHRSELIRVAVIRYLEDLVERDGEFRELLRRFSPAYYILLKGDSYV